MSCREILKNVSAYADGELPGTERPALEAHLERCAACSRAAEDYRRLDDIAGRDRPPPVTGEEWARLWENVISAGQQPSSLASRSAPAAQDRSLDPEMSFDAEGEGQDGTAPEDEINSILSEDRVASEIAAGRFEVRGGRPKGRTDATSPEGPGRRTLARPGRFLRPGTVALAAAAALLVLGLLLGPRILRQADPDAVGRKSGGEPTGEAPGSSGREKTEDFANRLSGPEPEIEVDADGTVHLKYEEF